MGLKKPIGNLLGKHGLLTTTSLLKSIDKIDASMRPNTSSLNVIYQDRHATMPDKLAVDHGNSCITNG